MGLDATESISSFRARLTRLAIYPEYEDKNWEPITIGKIGYIPETLDFTDRVIDIAWPAMEEALLPFDNQLEKPNQLPVLIGLPEPRPGLSDFLNPLLLQSMEKLGRQKQLNLDITLIPNGHSSGLMALNQAREKITALETDYVLIGGMDSYLHKDTLSWLEKSGRLLCSYNSNGFIPGEAAAFCLLASPKIIEEINVPVKATVTGTACTQEENCFGSKRPCLGQGLTKAIQTSLIDLKKEDLIQQVFCAFNGEDYPAKEWAYTSVRIGKRLENPENIISGTGSWGDVGAATGPLLICHAVHSGEWGYAKGPTSLLFTSSLGKDRAAALLNVVINQERRKKWEK